MTTVSVISRVSAEYRSQQWRDPPFVARGSLALVVRSAIGGLRRLKLEYRVSSRLEEVTTCDSVGSFNGMQVKRRAGARTAKRAANHTTAAPAASVTAAAAAEQAMRRGRRPACGCAPRGCGSATLSRRELHEAEGEPI
eukprot:scaffold73853_cov50-Phaeocystis_antarctica.AAC.6